jgi:RNA polymerase sigma-70 factor (ECF subfamily)
MDKKKFSKIYLNYFEPLCVYAYRFFQEKDEAYEIVQDVMLKLWEKKDTLLSNIDCIEKYLYRAVHNGCINKLEKLKVQNKYTDYRRLKLLEIELEDFEESFYQWEIREKINSEVENLSPKEKKIFELRYSENMKYREIASLLNISERTVETHLQKAIKFLRKKLKKFR